MSIVNTSVPVTSAGVTQTIEKLVQTYPFLRTETLTRTTFGRPVQTLVLGSGPRKLLYAAAFHGNEWITALILLKFAEDFAAAYEAGGQIGGRNAQELWNAATVYLVPLTNPDGVDLVTGAIQEGTPTYEYARLLAESYPNIPFPQGWKANLLGVDLNLQYPAGWLQAREIKFSQGYTQPGPRDYVGRYPLSQPESQALSGFTEFLEPALVLAFHSQGKEIYWQFEDIAVPGAQELGEKLAQASGYTLADTPYNSSFAGFKDWFIKVFHRPGYTIEVGSGENPLPIEQFDEIYADNLGIMLTAMEGL